MLDSDRCPCHSGDTYADCCGRLHRGFADGVTAPTAEALMRSRYSAFAVGDAAYLLATWAPAARPASLDLDDDTEWRGLEILRTEAGGPFDTAGVVKFVARYRDRASRQRGALRETSRFVREQGRWFYVDGDVEA